MRIMPMYYYGHVEPESLLALWIVFNGCFIFVGLLLTVRHLIFRDDSFMENVVFGDNMVPSMNTLLFTIVNGMALIIFLSMKVKALL